MGKILVTGNEKEGADSCHENRCEALISKLARFKSRKVMAGFSPRDWKVIPSSACCPRVSLRKDNND